MKTLKGEKYLLHWSKNPSIWNENLKDLIRSERVKKIKGRYYTIVTAHFTGDFNIVDCTCSEEGDFYPIYTENLIK